MTTVSKRSQINLYDNVNGDLKFSLVQSNSNCSVSVPTEWHVDTSALKLTSSGQVVNNVAASILENGVAVVAEQTRALGAEAGLQTNIDNEASLRASGDAANTAAIGVNQGLITTETTNRMAAVTAEANARTAAVEAEGLARSEADTTLQTNIDEEKAARIAADVIHTASIGAETDRANLAEEELAFAINTEKQRIDLILNDSEGALDQFHEIVSAYNAADAGLQGMITTLTTEFNALKAVVDSLVPADSVPQ